mmetsp:Transcript_143276/g.260679  ORF Transcript_143276/g.260679 Transcript_143276/m.260679 type:complete len:233 (+) Transcript_143276:352-1050(+)
MEPTPSDLRKFASPFRSPMLFGFSMSLTKDPGEISKLPGEIICLSVLFSFLASADHLISGAKNLVQLRSSLASLLPEYPGINLSFPSWSGVLDPFESSNVLSVLDDDKLPSSELELVVCLLGLGASSPATVDTRLNTLSQLRTGRKGFLAGDGCTPMMKEPSDGSKAGSPVQGPDLTAELSASIAEGSERQYCSKPGGGARPIGLATPTEPTSIDAARCATYMFTRLGGWKV